MLALPQGAELTPCRCSAAAGEEGGEVLRDADRDRRRGRRRRGGCRRFCGG